MNRPQLPAGHRYIEAAARQRYLRALDENGYEYVVGCHSEKLPGGERVITDTRYRADGTPVRKQWHVDAKGQHTPIVDTDDAATNAMPDRYKGVEWGGVKRNFTGQAAEDRCRRWSTNLGQIGTRNCLWLHGPQGTGKSSIAALVVRDAIKAGKADSRLWDWSELLRDIKASWDEERKDGDAIDKLISMELLVLDDVCKDKPTEWAAQVLYEIVNGRDRRNLSTMFTSNYGLKAAMERYDSDHGPFIRDRIGDASEVELAGASNR